jgi:hypothetical protein
VSRRRKYIGKDGQLFISFPEVAGILRELGGAVRPGQDPAIALYQAALLFLRIEQEGYKVIEEENDAG